MDDGMLKGVCLFDFVAAHLEITGPSTVAALGREVAIMWAGMQYGQLNAGIRDAQISDISISAAQKVRMDVKYNITGGRQYAPDGSSAPA